MNWPCSPLYPPAHQGCWLPESSQHALLHGEIIWGTRQWSEQQDVSNPAGSSCAGRFIWGNTPSGAVGHVGWWNEAQPAPLQPEGISPPWLPMSKALGAHPPIRNRKPKQKAYLGQPHKTSSSHIGDTCPQPLLAGYAGQHSISLQSQERCCFSGRDR